MAKNWWDEANEMTMGTILTKLGANPYKGKDNRWGPCPLCGEDQERKIPRPPVRVFWRNGYETFSCNHCQVWGGHFELMARYHFNCSSWTLKNQGRFHELKKHPPKDELLNFIKSCEGFEKESKEANYLISRGINPWAIPAKRSLLSFDCTELSIREGSDKPWWQNEWLKRFPITVPLMNYRAEIKSVLGRTLRKNTKWKSIGAHVIGIRNTAIDHLKLFPWKHFQSCYIATDADQSGERYAKKIPDLVIPATPFRVKFKGVK